MADNTNTITIPVGPGKTAQFAVAATAPVLAETSDLDRERTKTEFRQLLTATENVLIDNFSVAEFVAEVPAIRALSVPQRAAVRSAIARYQDAQGVVLSDPLTQQFVAALGALGLLDNPDRTAAILSGEAP